MQAGLSMRNLDLCESGPNQAQCGQRGPHEPPKDVGNSGKIARCQRVAGHRANLLGWSWAQSDPDGPQKEARWCTWKSKPCRSYRNVGPFGGSFAASGGQRRHNMGNIPSKEASPIARKTWKSLVKTKEEFDDFWLGPQSPFSAKVASKWFQIGAKLGRGCGQVGPSWAEVGALLAEADPKLGQLGPCRIETVHVDEIGPIYKICKLPESCALFGGLSKMAPSTLAEAVLDWQIRHSWHPPLNYHASAPLVRADSDSKGFCQLLWSMVLATLKPSARLCLQILLAVQMYTNLVEPFPYLIHSFLCQMSWVYQRQARHGHNITTSATEPNAARSGDLNSFILHWCPLKKSAKASIQIVYTLGYFGFNCNNVLTQHQHGLAEGKTRLKAHRPMCAGADLRVQNWVQNGAPIWVPLNPLVADGWAEGSFPRLRTKTWIMSWVVDPPFGETPIDHHWHFRRRWCPWTIPVIHAKNHPSTMGFFSSVRGKTTPEIGP